MLTNVALAVTWVGLTCYALFAGADFGAGTWDLLAGRATAGADRRRLIEHSITPVWEANHVWLIFVVVMLWTCFPPVFASVMSTLYLPLTLAALGIIARGAAFAFRKASETFRQRQLFGALFAASSVLTPFFLGAVAGGIASGRVPAGIAAGDPVRSWTGPSSLLGGVLAVLVCAYLAAVYLCADADRSGAPDLAAAFRWRALGTGVLTGVVALAGIAVLAADAPRLYDGLTGRALPLVVFSAVAGVAEFPLLWWRRYLAARVVAALAVVAIVWGWGVAQYPTMLEPHLTAAAAVAQPSVLSATLIVLAVGAVLLVPSLWWLYSLSQRPERTPPPDPPPSPDA
ncbi:MAG: cytochrome d ubiquinol oxidase subunit II [Actinocatenispora sp.]